MMVISQYMLTTQSIENHSVKFAKGCVVQNQNISMKFFYISFEILKLLSLFGAYFFSTE